MCVTLKCDGHVIETVGQAKARFGDSLRWSEGAVSILGIDADAFCLCSVDVEATAEAMGRKVVCDDFDPWFQEIQ